MQYTTINGVNFVNLTPHEVAVVAADGEIYKIPASGVVARAEQRMHALQPVAGIFACSRMTYGSAFGIPAPRDGFVYIVSARTAQAVSGRDDIVIPGPKVADAEGRAVACNGFSRI